MESTLTAPAQTGDPALAALAAEVQVLPVSLEVDEFAELRALVLDRLKL